MKNIHLSVVTPVYNCSSCLIALSERLKETLSSITNDYEIIMINDGSPDNSWDVIQALAIKDSKIKGINLSRNFGQHKAITAGLDYASGNWVVVMDCDLQDQPEEILKLYNEAQNGFDIVRGRRIHRQDYFFKKLSSKLFYFLYNYLTESKTDSTVSNFSIISSTVVEKLCLLHEQNRTYPLFLNWVGFKSSLVNVEHAQRKDGKSSYTFRKLISLAIDSIVSQSNKPLKLSIKFGFLLSFASCLYAAWLMLRYFMYSVPVAGWTSVMVSIYFIAGLLFANMGILGLYIGKTFNESKNRPLYIIQETTHDK